jgi:ankyrin repeat protein
VAVFGPVGHFEELLKQGIDMNGKNLFGETPLCASVCAGRVDIVEALVRAGAGPEAGLLREAIEWG